MENRMELTFTACPQNEAFARVAVAAFAVQLSPTLSEMADIKTAVSEAVTNAIVHGYRDLPSDPARTVRLKAVLGERRVLIVSVADDGCGIPDVSAAMQPFFSTGDETERSGMGFCVMQTFMDAVEVESTVGKGTTVTMRKYVAEPAKALPAPAAARV